MSEESLPIVFLVRTWRSMPEFHSLSLLEKGLLFHIFYRHPGTSSADGLRSPSVPDLFYVSISDETGTPYDEVIGAVASLTRKGFLSYRSEYDFRYFYTGHNFR